MALAGFEDGVRDRPPLHVLDVGVDALPGDHDLAPGGAAVALKLAVVEKPDDR